MNKLAVYASAVDECLKRIVDGSGYPDELKAVLDYSLFPGGKRLRPSLFLAWHEVTAAADERAVLFASGIELFHTFSLVHDDMPCLDNDDCRRGKPSVHKAFGEAKALLAGDALLNLAYTAMLEGAAGDGTLTLFVSKLFGDCGVISGQYDDVFNKCATVDDVMGIYKRKTAALIYASCVAGCVFPRLNKSEKYKETFELLHSTAAVLEGTTGDRTLNAAMKYGAAFGTAFQLYDDISECLDGDRPDSASVLDYLSLDEAKTMLASLTDDAERDLSDIDGDTDVLKELARKFVIK